MDEEDRNMKSFTITAVAVTACFLLSGIAGADNAEFRLVNTRNDMAVSGAFYADLQIRITSGTSPRTLNGLTADVQFGSNLTGTSATAWAFGTTNGYSRTADLLPVGSPTYYRVTVTGNGVNENKSIPGDPPGWDVTTSWKTLVTLRWTINTLGTVDVGISDITDAAAYFNTLTNAYEPPAVSDGATNWVVSNEDLVDVSLPVQMTNLSARATSREGVTLSWSTESETNSAGFHVRRGESENAIDRRITAALIPSHGTSSSRNEYSYTDRNAHGRTYWYRIEEVSLDGESLFIGPISVEAAEPLPEQFSVSRNYPNPFNPETTLHYELPEDADVSVRVFDLMGREVKTLVDGRMTAGRYDARWDGTNPLGNAVSSGIYFVRVQAGDYSGVRKVTLMR
jgi:hypothetical protein